MYCPERLNYDRKYKFFLEEEKHENAKYFVEFDFYVYNTSALVLYLWKVKCVDSLLAGENIQYSILVENILAFKNTLQLRRMKLNEDGGNGFVPF